MNIIFIIIFTYNIGVTAWFISAMTVALFKQGGIDGLFYTPLRIFYNELIRARRRNKQSPPEGDSYPMVVGTYWLIFMFFHFRWQVIAAMSIPAMGGYAAFRLLRGFIIANNPDGFFASMIVGFKYDDFYAPTKKEKEAMDKYPNLKQAHNQLKKEAAQLRKQNTSLEAVIQASKNGVNPHDFYRFASGNSGKKASSKKDPALEYLSRSR